MYAMFFRSDHTKIKPPPAIFGMRSRPLKMPAWRGPALTWPPGGVPEITLGAAALAVSAVAVCKAVSIAVLIMAVLIRG